MVWWGMAGVKLLLLDQVELVPEGEKKKQKKNESKCDVSMNDLN